MSDFKTKHHKELLIQKEIAETLNQSVDMEEMLQKALEKLLELMGLETGWIFLTTKESSYELVAHHNLPPALAREGMRPMLCEECSCLSLYWEGNLNNAVNRIKCARLDEAVLTSQGDTRGLTHHATIPLTVRCERFGLLNLASLGRKHFDDDELILLESVAYQIGTAVERTRLYEQKKKQAEDKVARYIIDYFASTEQVNRRIWNINDLNQLLLTIAEQIRKYFDFSQTVAMIIQQNKQLTLKTIVSQDEPSLLNEVPLLQDKECAEDIISLAYQQQHVYQSHERPFNYSSLKQSEHLFSIALPLKAHVLESDSFGVLLISRGTEAFSGLEVELLELLANHISLALAHVRLYEESQSLLLAEERNRIARDLHDSVNQKLFALSLTARGLKEMFANEGNDIVAEAISDIQQLSQEALTEMRSLIWQLRPYGLDKGLHASLEDYAKKIGVQLISQSNKIVQLPEQVEEVLWRIGQEALNNVSKHAHTKQAELSLEAASDQVKLVVSDQGCGGQRNRTVPLVLRV